jgi:hypothetical protein
MKIDDLPHVHVGKGVAHNNDEGLVEALGEPLDPSHRSHKLVLSGKVDLRAVHLGRSPIEPQDYIC